MGGLLLLVAALALTFPLSALATESPRAVLSGMAGPRRRQASLARSCRTHGRRALCTRRPSLATPTHSRARTCTCSAASRTGLTLRPRTSTTRRRTSGPRLAPVPVTSEAPAAALLNGKIYLAEGDTGDSFNIYDIATNTWSSGPPRPGYANNYGAAAGAFGGKVYVVGGGRSGATDTTSIYTVATNSWTTGPPAPVPFFLAGYTTVGQYLYVVGGFSAAGPTANVGVTMRLDMATGSWSLGPTFTPGRADEGLAASGNTLYALGGDANGGGFFDSTAACRLARRQRLAERLVDLGRRSASEPAPGQRGRLLLDRPGRRRGVVDRRDQRCDVPVPGRAPVQGRAAATSASSASAASSSTSATTSASAASGPLPCPESARAAPRRCEDEDPESALLGWQGAPRSLSAVRCGAA